VHKVAGEITVQIPTLKPVEALIAVTVKLVGKPPVPEPVPTSIATEPLDAVSVAVGVSGAVGSQTAISVVFTVGVIVVDGWIELLPVDQALKE
jgi:hypothetical protein